MRVIHRLSVVAAALVLLMVGGCAVNPVTGRQELALFTITPSQEIQLGQEAFPKAVQQMGGEYDDPALAAYVNGVGKRVAQVAERPELPYEFRVLNDSTPNAFALPGGFVAITRGLLVSLENEAQLAAVLGHEVGHVTARDSVQGMQRGTLLGAGLAVLSAATGSSAYGGVAQKAGQLAAGLLDNRFSREQERQADRLGVDYMVRAGYNPRGSVQLQEFFYRTVEAGAEPMWLAGLFRTHPFSKERMLALEAYIAERYSLQQSDPRFVLNEQPFQRAVSGLRQSSKGYELYDQARQQEQQGHVSQAIATYLQAATVAPDQALILTGLGMAYLHARDVRAARPHLARAVQLDGNYYLSHLGLGLVYLELDDESAAISHLEKSMNLLPTDRGGYLLAMGHEKQGRIAKAADLYRQIAEAYPQSKIGQAAARKVAELQAK
ncbi:peptidase lipoprotein, M48 family, TPR domain-containing [Syntrophotalea carbinolica DSM 2380]|uniref:Peptidase lipoprotein, M48 family, TPR domain-containing n=1 Tax=Syntrophotalea carbinolica (strain DSM 2380 / NBRC 103641 / GraBd1) TaxID=338963 RepID=Q3A596_SYNC1|nr:M48 family metallopeptidase [Syntrophotalea carbinolica]ABA88461.2 peptidase lipoprotein, M48 family, TPR domain-containing [Syntrophotalea carbinolica DSM 2380]